MTIQNACKASTHKKSALARLDFLTAGALTLLVGAFILVEAVLSGGLLAFLGLFGVAIPCVFCFVLGAAVIKVGMRSKDLPDEPDNSERDPSPGT
jgi:hypothetical protein